MTARQFVRLSLPEILDDTISDAALVLRKHIEWGQRLLTPVERFHDSQGGSDQRRIREDAADPGHPFVGADKKQGVDAVLGAKLAAPSALRCRARQSESVNVVDAHLLAPLAVGDRVSGVGVTG